MVGAEAGRRAGRGRLERDALRRGLVAAFLAALVIHVADVIVVGPIRTPDTAGFFEAALALRASLLTDAEIFMTKPPLYSVLLAILPSDQAVVLVQALLSALVAPLAGLAAGRRYGARAGVITAAAAAVMPPFIEWTPYILSDVLALACLAAGVERLSAALADGRLRDSALSGGGTALAVLTRPAYTLALGALGVGAALRRTGRLRHAAFFALGAVLLVLPLVARNVAATGTVELYEGRGWYLAWQGIQWNEDGRGTAGVDVIFPPDLESRSTAEQLDFYRETTVRAFTEHPLDQVRLMSRKALWYVLPYYPQWSLAHKAVSLVTLGWLYVFAVVGLWARRRDPFTWALVLTAASFTVMAMLTIVDYDARYRLPFILSLLPLAGAGTAGLLDRVRRPQVVAPQS